MTIHNILSQIAQEKGLSHNEMADQSPFIVQVGGRFFRFAYINEQHPFDPELGRFGWECKDFTEQVKSLGLGMVKLFGEVNTSLRSWLEANYPAEYAEFTEEDWFFGGEAIVDVMNAIFGREKAQTVLAEYTAWAEIKPE